MPNSNDELLHIAHNFSTPIMECIISHQDSKCKKKMLNLEIFLSHFRGF